MENERRRKTVFPFISAGKLFFLIIYNPDFSLFNFIVFIRFYVFYLLISLFLLSLVLIFVILNKVYLLYYMGY